MDLSEQYRKLSVKITCKEDYVGSGCLFQADSDVYTYAITAKHCLEGEDFSHEFLEDNSVNTEDLNFFTIKDIQVERFNNNGTWNSYNVKGYFHHNDFDLAVILLEKNCDFDSPAVANCRGNDKLVISGFPIEMEGTLENPKENIKCDFCETTEELIYIKSNDPLIKVDENAGKSVDYARGLSGAGVYGEFEGALYVVGIFIGFKDSRLGYDELEAIKIDSINKTLKIQGFPLLYNPKLTSFSLHIDNAYKTSPVKIAYELKKFSSSIENIKPLDIIQTLGPKLFFPYGEENLINDELWCSWLKVITYLNIYLEVSIDNVSFKEYVYNPECKFKHYYCSKSIRLEEIVKYIFNDIYNDLNKSGCIIISTNVVPDKKYLDKETVGNILPDIADELFEKGVDIFNPQTRKNLSCVHVNYLQQILADGNYEYIKDSEHRQNEIRQCIKEVLVSVAD